MPSIYDWPIPTSTSCPKKQICPSCPSHLKPHLDHITFNPYPLTLLIQMDSYADILKSLRRESVSVRSRLQSIIVDHRYILQFQPFALVANERCGLWYVPPGQRAESVYFKSTDGHTGEWSFSERRTNFHLLHLLAAERTVVVVDSTRKGKLLPDALLKTIPIWCAVLCWVMFDGETVPDLFAAVAADNWLVTPREMVLASEHAAIAAKIPQFGAEAVRLGLILKEKLRQRLGALQPVIPCWMWPGKSGNVAVEDTHFSVCCASASTKNKTPPEWKFDGPYVQGAGDDHELWAGDICGGAFDHDVFWNLINSERRAGLRVVDDSGDICLWLSEEELLSRMEQIYRGSERDVGKPLDITQLGDTGIYLGQITENVALDRLVEVVPRVKAVVVLSPEYMVTTKAKKAKTDETDKTGSISGENSISLNTAAFVSSAGDSPGNDSASDAKNTPEIRNFSVESSKKGSKQLREILPAAADVCPRQDAPVVVLCDTGKDLGVGVVLCLLGRHYTSAWEVALLPAINKDIIKQHLNRMLEFRKINPSRNTLQSVNTFLMAPR